MFTAKILCSILVGLTLRTTSEFPINLCWTTNLQTFLESAPSVADINLDGKDEIIVAGREEIIAVDGTGKVLWRTPGKGRFMTYPAIYTDEKMSRIYAADCSGWLHCIDGDGHILWSKQLTAAAEWSASVVAPLLTEKYPCVIQGDSKGNLYVFHAITGDLIWHIALEGAVISPAVANIRGDSLPEVVLTTNSGKLYCISNDGTVLWVRLVGAPSPTWATGAPVIFASSTKQVNIIAPAAEGALLCFDNDGNLLWHKTLFGPIASAVSAADIDADGRTDIFAITQLGMVHRFQEDGTPLWQIDMQGRTLAAGAIIDIDNDGNQDFVLATQQGRLLSINIHGKIFWEWQAPSRTINVTPTFGKLTNKKTLQMVITGGESGLLYCFDTPAQMPHKPQWIAYRANAEKTGAWLALHSTSTITMTPVHLNWDNIYLDEPVRFLIENPTNDLTPITASVTVHHPNGLSQHTSGKIIGTSGIVEIPLVPSSPGEYVISWEVGDTTNPPAFHRTEHLFLTPFQNECSLLESAIHLLSQTAYDIQQTLPLSYRALQREKALLEHYRNELNDIKQRWHDPSADRDQLLSRAKEILLQTRHRIKTARAIKAAAQQHNSCGIIVSEGLLWENRNVDIHVPIQADQNLVLYKTVVPGEHEPVAINLFNITDRTLTIRIRAKTTGATTTLFHAFPVVTSSGFLAWDALPPIDETGILTVPSLETRQVWVDTEFPNDTRGESNVLITLEVLNGPGVQDPPHHPQTVPPPTATVEFKFTVLPFSLAPTNSVRLCMWAKLDANNVQDLLCHGNNVFVVPLPQYTCQNHDSTEQKLDDTQIADLLHMIGNHEVFLLLSGMPNLNETFGSDAYKNKLAIYLNDLRQTLANMNIGLTNFALYPYDEPGGHGWEAIETVATFGEMVKAIQPNMLIYVNGGGEAPMFERLAPITDIWCPGIYMLPENTPEMNIIRKTNKPIWSYNCAYSFARPVGANTKDINVIAEFRTAALFALRYGATGIGFWCYNIGDDMWLRVRDEYPLVYNLPQGIVTSRRWEAVRESIEDFRIAKTLLDFCSLINETRCQKLTSQIHTLLQTELATWMDTGYQLVRLGAPRYAIDFTYNEQKMNAFREKLLQLAAQTSEINNNLNNPTNPDNPSPNQTN